ncbi:hypothetical protein ABW21_db0206619 [Orbilia brochopaga]|nr:hypothetical protein ABW21_db0206619 [Drechslerella brochopaga]
MSVYDPDGHYIGPMATPPPSLPDDEVINVDLPSYQPYGYGSYGSRRFSGREDYGYAPGFRYIRRDDPSPRRSRERRRPSKSRERQSRNTGYDWEHSRSGLRRYPRNDLDEDEPAPRYRRHRGRSSDRDRCTTCSRCAGAKPSRDTGIDHDLARIFDALRSLKLGDPYAPVRPSTKYKYHYQAPTQKTYYRSTRERDHSPVDPYPSAREPNRRSHSRRRPQSPSEYSDTDTYRWESQFRDDLYTINGRMGRRRGSWSEFIEIPSRGGESFDKMAARFLRMSGDGFHAIKMRKDMHSGRTFVSQWIAETDGFYRDY